MVLKRYFLNIWILCHHLTSSIPEYENIIVEIENGQLKGYVQYTVISNKKFYSFKGIPYAAAPIGELRFQAPQSPPSWNGVRDALECGSRCVQPDLGKELLDKKFEGDIEGSEDCLFINVYTPEIPNENPEFRPKAVMFYIYGGSFKSGTSEDKFYAADFFIDEDVVVVTFNYRLGILGFLSLENVEAPGNYGLKDIIKALQWVKQNIVKFGGDPNNVTLYGNSAGSISAHLFLMSPLAKGLFHKIICQSGSLINADALSPPNMKQIAFKVGERLGLEGNDSQALLKLLRSADAYQIANVSEYISISSSTHMIPYYIIFAPTVEPKEVEDAVFTTDPVELLKTGQFTKVPILIGHTSDEYIIRLDNDILKAPVLEAAINDLKINFPLRGMQVPFNSSLYEHIQNELKSMYLLNDNKEDLLSNYIQLQSDLWRSFVIELHGQILSEVSTEPTYFYRFSYDGGLNVIKSLKGLNISGSSHADELCYIFACDSYISAYKTLKEDSQDMKMIKTLTRLFSNFIKTGNPTPSKDKTLYNVTWLPRTSKNNLYLNIGKELTMQKHHKNNIYNKLSELFKYVSQNQDLESYNILKTEIITNRIPL